jgi:Kef-type K+ transport system membrane component KefB/nucleotide-binding universal stress UspA family protein
MPEYVAFDINGRGNLAVTVPVSCLMQSLSEHQLLTGLLSMASMLLIGRGTAEVARRWGQPEVLGELIGGFLIGPSLLGALFPGIYHQLFSDPGVGMALSMFAWTGAILLLMVAGAEVDLSILTEHIKAGSLTACFTIIPSIAAGTAFGIYLLNMNMISALFLGSVFSVTAVSVIGKILIERQTLRRNYAQVIMAGGIASEVVVWPLLSALSAAHAGETWLAGLRTTFFAAAFFAVMLTLGQKFTDLVMRRIVDVTTIIYGQLSLLIVLGFIFAGVTEVLGLHALLGPFVFGVLIGRAPRTTIRLKENLHSLTLSVFATVFFVTAGMRVDITKLGHWRAIALTLALFAAAMATKVVFGFIGARLGGLRPWESVIVGLGTNMRGGTDVIVAILGGSLGIIPESTYTMYAIAAILTVLVSPPLIAVLEKKVPPTESELKRLSKEEARGRAYLSTVEKVLLPTFPELNPADCVPILRSIATTKETESEVFDIAELAPDNHTLATQSVSDSLKEAGDSQKTEYSQIAVDESGTIAAVLEASKQCDLLVIGARRAQAHSMLSFGHVQDQIIDQASSDVLVITSGGNLMSRRIKRILVPINGMEYAMAAADIAGYVAKANDAELVVMTVITGHGDKAESGPDTDYGLRRSGHKILKETRFRTRRLDVRYQEKIIVGKNSTQEILDELKRGRYDLILMGAVDRTGDKGFYLGSTVESILIESSTPSCVLVYHQKPATAV